jgi:hypothetical protein
MFSKTVQQISLMPEKGIVAACDKPTAKHEAATPSASRRTKPAPCLIGWMQK